MMSLTVFCGPMGSSKTTKALHTARRYQRLNHKVVLFRPSTSRRSHESFGKLVTKNGEDFPAIETVSTEEIKPLSKEFDVVWIDEVFLFKDEDKLFDVIQDIRKDKEIIVSALGADCMMTPFGATMPKLLSVADNIIFCKADCDFCGGMNSATRTLLCVPATREGQTFVGGTESYCACCVGCWNFLMDLPAEKRKEALGYY